MKKTVRPAYHHGDLRNSLLAAAEALLMEKGVAALSLREVAKATGVSHAAPYRHFRDKAALVEALAATGFKRLQHGCEQAALRHANDPARQLTEAGMAYLLFATEKPAIVHLMFGGSISLGACGADLQQAADAAYASLARIVGNGQQSGLYQQADVMDMTLTAWSAVYGFSLMLTGGLLGKRVSTRAKLRLQGEAIAQILLNGLLRR